MLVGGRAGPSGEGFARLRDLNELRNFLANGGVMPILDAPWIPLYVAVLFLFDPLFGWVAIAGGLVIATIVVISEEKALGMYTKAAESGHCGALKRLAVAYEKGELGVEAA